MVTVLLKTSSGLWYLLFTTILDFWMVTSMAVLQHPKPCYWIFSPTFSSTAKKQKLQLSSRNIMIFFLAA